MSDCFKIDCIECLRRRIIDLERERDSLMAELRERRIPLEVDSSSPEGVIVALYENGTR